ncbi:PQQ-binding-like beta-propeller repeat protein [Gammaproteobacteria bacterium]|nr:PQQ-binding-like beta-propeller repeat protein [Gammaproteobacteria bacterium]
MKKFLPCYSVILSIVIFQSAFAQVQLEPHPGRAVYEQFCASCHNFPEQTRSPGLAALQEMSFRNIGYALTDGKMKEQAAALSAEQRDALMGYLVRNATADTDWIAANMCSAESQGFDPEARASVSRWGINLENHRRMSAAQSGLTSADLGKLELAWAIGFPDNASMRSQPVVVGDTLFIASVETAQLFAFDIAAQPCLLWVYQASLPLRSGLNYGEISANRKVVIVNDSAARVHMLDAGSGELIWMTDVKVNEKSQTTGSSIIYGDRVYVPISAFELNVGANAEYECCTSHGAVAALDANTGEHIWVGHTMAEAVPTRLSRVGVQQWGPSGAPIWTTPAIDAKRGVLYAGTGENTSIPATDTSDAIIAFDLDDGSIRWKFQATANDIFLTGCMFNPDGPNCPPASANSINADYDFGASVIIAQQADGTDVLLAGQKSGVLWALDPDNNGALLWSLDVGPGGPLGGIHWGMAFDGERVFVPINQVGAPGEDPDREPGFHAVDVQTGELAWSFYNQPDCSGDRLQRMPGCANAKGMSGAPLVIDTAVVQGSLDGFIRVFNAQDGEILFQYDTARTYTTANGVQGTGGGIDNATIVAANGMLLISSGYSLVGAQPGNVLLAFKPGNDAR